LEMTSLSPCLSGTISPSTSLASSGVTDMWTPSNATLLNYSSSSYDDQPSPLTTVPASGDWELARALINCEGPPAKLLNFGRFYILTVLWTFYEYFGDLFRLILQCFVDFDFVWVCLVALRHLVLFEPGLKTRIERVSSVLRASFNVLLIK
jgi:hypothetical protein